MSGGFSPIPAPAYARDHLSWVSAMNRAAITLTSCVRMAPQVKQVLIHELLRQARIRPEARLLEIRYSPTMNMEPDHRLGLPSWVPR